MAASLNWEIGNLFIKPAFGYWEIVILGIGKFKTQFIKPAFGHGDMQTLGTWIYGLWVYEYWNSNLRDIWNWL